MYLNLLQTKQYTKKFAVGTAHKRTWDRLPRIWFQNGKPLPRYPSSIQTLGGTLLVINELKTHSPEIIDDDDVPHHDGYSG